MTSLVESPKKKLKLILIPLLIFLKNKLLGGLAHKTEMLNQKDKVKLEETIVKAENKEDHETNKERDLKEKKETENQEDKKETEDLEMKKDKDLEDKTVTEDQEERKGIENPETNKVVREDNLEKAQEQKESQRLNGQKWERSSPEKTTLIYS